MEESCTRLAEAWAVRMERNSTQHGEGKDGAFSTLHVASGIKTKPKFKRALKLRLSSCLLNTVYNKFSTLNSSWAGEHRSSDGSLGTICFLGCTRWLKKDGDKASSPAVPVTQQTEYTVWSAINVSQSVPHWLIEKPCHKKKKKQINLDS